MFNQRFEEIKEVITACRVDEVKDIFTGDELTTFPKTKEKFLHHALTVYPAITGSIENYILMVRFLIRSMPNPVASPLIYLTQDSIERLAILFCKYPFFIEQILEGLEISALGNTDLMCHFLYKALYDPACAPHHSTPDYYKKVGFLLGAVDNIRRISTYGREPLELLGCMITKDYRFLTEKVVLEGVKMEDQDIMDLLCHVLDFYGKVHPSQLGNYHANIRSLLARVKNIGIKRPDTWRKKPLVLLARLACKLHGFSDLLVPYVDKVRPDMFDTWFPRYQLTCQGLSHFDSAMAKRRWDLAALLWDNDEKRVSYLATCYIGGLPNIEMRGSDEESQNIEMRGSDEEFQNPIQSLKEFMIGEMRSFLKINTKGAPVKQVKKQKHFRFDWTSVLASGSLPQITGWDQAEFPKHKMYKEGDEILSVMLNKESVKKKVALSTSMNQLEFYLNLITQSFSMLSEIKRENYILNPMMDGMIILMDSEDYISVSHGLLQKELSESLEKRFQIFLSNLIEIQMKIMQACSEYGETRKIGLDCCKIIIGYVIVDTRSFDFFKPAPVSLASLETDNEMKITPPTSLSSLEADYEMEISLPSSLEEEAESKTKLGYISN